MAARRSHLITQGAYTTNVPKAAALRRLAFRTVHDLAS
eukprot:CAMPEP_0119376562 /NCGR_PEP_ID=MMETSP1334-20130426/40145_1 /TAXON_ID=127549 /ORGANISM="Calcidiscus leptoporus, Strain RCC1130" /LENGTH=37 /DNA_ID= /DNA_START= /DNA_END= /DNA_ORIENTATION=